jgi:hypothetical protein
MLIEEKLRQENRQLLDINRRLEQQKDECKAKLDLLDIKSTEYMTKIKNDMQVRRIEFNSKINLFLRHLLQNIKQLLMN